MPAPAPAIIARQAATTTQAAATASPQSGAISPSTFIPIVVIGLLIILTVAGLFGYRAWKGRQMVSETKMSRQEKKLNDWYNGSDEDSIIEKPKKAALAGDVEAYAGWKPQIRTWRGIPVQGAQPSSESGDMEKISMGGVTPPPQPSPPPSYPEAKADKKPAALRLSIDPEDKPVVSPNRSSSMFATQQKPENPFITKEESKASQTDDSLPLPRIMIVQNTFTPNLDDELPVVRGEAIRMLAEYKDGWCVVQRVGPFDSPKGVVPRTCLQERQKALVPQRRV